MRKQALKYRCLLVLLLGLSAVVCRADGRTVRLAVEADSGTLDPYERMIGDAFRMENLVSEPLWRIAHGEIEMVLASEFIEQSPTQFVAALREGVQFHSGNMLTGKDVCWTFRRAQSSQMYGEVFHNVASCEVRADGTLAFSMHKPDPAYLNYFHFLTILDSRYYEGLDAQGQPKSRIDDESKSWASAHISGTGPFSVEKYKPGEMRVFKRHPHWWNGSSGSHSVEKMVFQFETDSGKRLKALKSGEVDLIYPLPSSQLEQVSSSADIDTFSFDTDRIIHLTLNQRKNPALGDIHVRKALVYAVNQEEIVERVLHGMGLPSAQYSMPGYSGRNPSLKPRFDLRRAFSHLAKSKYRGNIKITFSAPNDRYFNDASIALAAASMIRRLGIEVELKTMRRKQYWPRVESRIDDMYMLGWSSDNGDSGNFFDALVSCGEQGEDIGTYNLLESCNDDMEALISRAAVSTNSKERAELYQKLEKMAYDRALFIPLHHEADVWGVSKRLDLSKVVLGKAAVALERIEVLW